MLGLKKTSYRKMHRRDSKVTQKCSFKLIKTVFCLKSLSCSRLTSQQIEAARQTMNKRMNRVGRVILCVFPNLAITAKPSEVRMGKGKGNVSYWCYPVKIGDVLFEFQGISRYTAEEVCRLGTSKLPVQTKFITMKQKI
jgi:large subunit ribosomal protein L16